MSDVINQNAKKDDTLEKTILSGALNQHDMGGLMEIILAIFQSLGFGNLNSNLSSSLSNLSNMSFSDIAAHPTFQNSLPNNFELDTSDLNFTTAQELMTDEGTRGALIDATVRTAVSIGIESYVEDAIARGVEYEFGAKDGIRSIDCSGFVSQAIRTAMGGVRDGVEIDAADVNITASFSNAVDKATITASEYQIQNLGKEAGILRNSDITMENMKAGMVIGLDSGYKGWDEGRELGIDHVGITYRDTETGKLMFAESASGKGGAHAMPMEEWLERANAKGWNLYGVDVVQLAKVDQELKAKDPALNDTLSAKNEGPDLEQDATGAVATVPDQRPSGSPTYS